MNLESIIANLNRIENNSYLYEGLLQEHQETMRLWESAGFKLKEAALTPDQIQQIFKNVEQGATDAGSNRTLLGKGKDAAAAVNKAWEELKTKVQNSGPIKNVDSAYDSVVAKIEAGLGGPDNAVNQVIQKYRQFAKDHPVAQGLIYSALIAAAGISGAGLGGAAVLGLLKMADKLLQGEKFSSAAYQGAKTGALAYGASKLGDYIKGKMGGDQAAAAGGQAPADIQKGLAADQAFQDSMLNKYPTSQGYTYSANGNSLEVFDSTGRKVFTGDIPLKTMDYKTFADLTNNGQMATPGISSGSASLDPMAGVRDTASSTVSGNLSGVTQDQIFNSPVYKQVYADQVAKFGSTAQGQIAAGRVAAAAAKAALLKGQTNESVSLSENQIQTVFSYIEDAIITEGILDTIKGAAGKAASWVANKGHNLTTKITVDKLNSAWKAAGSPTDSEEVKAFLGQQGVDTAVIDQAVSTVAPDTAPATEPPKDDAAGVMKAADIVKDLDAAWKKATADQGSETSSPQVQQQIRAMAKQAAMTGQTFEGKYSKHIVGVYSKFLGKHI